MKTATVTEVGLDFSRVLRAMSTTGQTVDWSRLSEAVWGCFSMVLFA